MEKSNIEHMTQQIMSLYIKACISEDTTEYGNSQTMYDLPITEIIDGVRLKMGIGMNTTCIRITRNNIRLLLRVHNLDGAAFGKTIRKCDSAYTYTINTIPYDNEVQAYNTRFTMLAVHEGVEKMVNMISSLSYDNLNGCFTEPRRRRKTKEYPECCICYEGTKTTFKACKHSVCGQCISNMIGRLKCPMCRLKIGDSDSDVE